MRTSLIETAQIDEWLNGQTSIEDGLVMEARLQTNPELKEKAIWQQRTYELIRIYGQKRLKEEIAAIEGELFQHSRFRTFQRIIFSVFNS